MKARIRTSTAKPSTKPIGTGISFSATKERLFFGVELECESVGFDADVMAQKVWPLVKDFCILKDDGSLHNGFEIVSRPASLDAHRKLWLPFFTDLPDGLKSWSRDTCGMHVHCTRAALTDLQIGKALVFINMKGNDRFIELIAGRSTHYAKINHNKTLHDVKRDIHRERYEALNLVPIKTIEFRIFKGTLNKHKFIKNIEFACSLLDFCRPCHTTVSESSSIPKFLEFVHAEKKKYPQLYRFLSDNKQYSKET